VETLTSFLRLSLLYKGNTMKKLFATFALAFAAIAASATTVGAGYEYMGVASQPGKTQQEKETFGLSEATKYGTFDAALTYGQTNGAQGNQTGYEVGYTYPLTVEHYAVLPRVALGNTSTLNADGHTAAVGVEVRRFAFGQHAFVSAEYQQNTANASTTQKSYQAGVDFHINKAFTVRTALKHVNISNVEAQNGIVASVKYSF